MESTLDAGKVRQLARALDDAIEKHAIEELVSYFSVECEIQLPGIMLSGHVGLRKAINWMYSYLKEITLIPITIIIKDNVFFEEFIMKAKIRGDKEIQVKQAEVLIYDADYKVRSLRLYFDRLELGKAFSTNAIDRLIIDKLSRESLKDLR
jgi:hypothetical protein